MSHPLFLSSIAFCLAAVCTPSMAADAVPPLQPVMEKAIKELSTTASGPEGAAFKELLAVLPRDFDGSFIVEGDLALSEEELVDHLLGLAPGSQSSGAGELKLSIHNGQMDFYAKPDRKLTYAIDKASFGDDARYREITELMEQATGEWEAIAPESGLDFVHVPEQDAAPAAGNVNFIVEFRDAGGLFIARSFFPHDSGEDRKLTIDPTFYTSQFIKKGVLLHELGHVLGYRHEHINGVPGCRREGGVFLTLTTEDPRSVMHYFCGGGGSLDMTLSPLDKQGHAIVYGG